MSTPIKVDVLIITNAKGNIFAGRFLLEKKRSQELLLRGTVCYDYRKSRFHTLCVCTSFNKSY